MADKSDYVGSWGREWMKEFIVGIQRCTSREVEDRKVLEELMTKHSCVE